MRTLNVGVIGAGFMGKAHSLAYAAMPMFFWPPPALPHRQVVAEISEERAAEAAIRFGYASHTSDWRRVVDDPTIDIVDVATPNDSHREIAVAALEAGKHVICEKPLASTVEDARLMWEAARRSARVNMVAFNYRRTPAVALAKKFLAEGAAVMIADVDAAGAEAMAGELGASYVVADVGEDASVGEMAAAAWTAFGVKSSSSDASSFVTRLYSSRRCGGGSVRRSNVRRVRWRCEETSWYGRPSIDGKVVRSDSWRRMISSSALSSACSFSFE